MKGHNPRWMENMPFLVEFVVAWRLTMLTLVLKFSLASLREMKPV